MIRKDCEMRTNNINVCYENLPDKDVFLSVWLENMDVKDVLANFNLSDENCICIYGVTEQDISHKIDEIKQYADELTVYIKSQNIQRYDIIIKPIFVFERKEDADIFTEFANRLGEQEFFDLIHELQLDYNVAWTSVEVFDNEKVYEIIDHYEGLK